MPSKRAGAERRPVSLHLADSFAGAWNDLHWHWFERIIPTVWQSTLPSAVIVPTRGQVDDLKARLLARGCSHFGLHFLTPTSLRERLIDTTVARHAQPEHLRLLLAIAANEIEKQPNESEALAAKSVTRSPALLLQALDRLEIAGWQFEDIGLSAFAPVVGRFNQLREHCGFDLPGKIDRRLLAETAGGKAKFSNVLVTGFDGAHWPQWYLLRAAVALANDATVVLEEPRAVSDLDLCWIGSWEEVGGEAKRSRMPIPRRDGDSLFTEAEMRGAPRPARSIEFLIGTNIAEQAEAITRQCLRYLAEENFTRLGVIFAAGGALPRLVASSFGRNGIPHNDGLAQIVPGVFESAEWQRWLELQRSPRLTSFLLFLNALPDSTAVAPKISRSEIENVLQQSYRQTLLDDLEVLREFCLSQPGENFQSVGEALRALPFLPSRATLAQFVAETVAALNALGWKQRALEIAAVAHDWPDRFNTEFSRAFFLRWLNEIAVSFRAARSTAGEHPYARVHLLTVPHAQGQEWSHLIFAGWNEGQWPPSAGAEFARAREIRAFNQRVQQLNRRASRQGSQGEGHTSVMDGHSLYEGPVERREIALRQFDGLLESATAKVTFAASLVQEDAPERLWNPSECVTESYLKTTGRPLTQVALKNLQRATSEFVNDESGTGAEKSISTPADIVQTLIAFRARRDPARPAGEYDFALRPDLSYRPETTLSVSDLERMVSSPAIVWMKRYLGVEAPEDTSNPWPAASGKWIHQYLATIASSNPAHLLSPLPSNVEVDERICAKAKRTRTALENLCDSLGKTVPDWWNSGWLNALYLARHLGARIARITDWKWVTAELPVGRAGDVQIDQNAKFQLRGRIDLVLAKEDVASFNGQNVWIVDYKTGRHKELKPTDLHDSLVKGITLQLGLYVLAMRAIGATDASASIIAPAVKKVEPQLSLRDLAPHTDVFADLATMQRTGAFGMKGEIRSSYKVTTDYPIATLQIDPDLLEDKWAITHPALVLEKEEWETW